MRVERVYQEIPVLNFSCSLATQRIDECSWLASSADGHAAQVLIIASRLDDGAALRSRVDVVRRTLHATKLEAVAYRCFVVGDPVSTATRAAGPPLAGERNRCCSRLLRVSHRVLIV